MWAQVQRVSTNPDREAEVLEIFEQLRAIEQEDSGLLQTLVMRSQTDPNEVFVVVVFESEEKARAREEDPRRHEALQGIRGAMGSVLNGPPEFFDCNVVLNE
jgi:heme-degrading monooxygenase HmoA